MPIQTYIPKRHTVQAIQLVTEEDASEIAAWVGKGARMNGEVRPYPVDIRGPKSLVIPTPMGMTLVKEGDYVLEVDKKVFFVLRPGEFEEEYIRGL